MRIVDANLLIYAFDMNSHFHEKAAAWLSKTYEEDDLVGLPRAVLLAFLRISTNPRAMNVAARPEDILKIIDRLVSHPKTIVVDCGPNHWTIFREVVSRSGVFGPAISDAFLASLAIEHGAVFCSSDEGFRRYAGLKFENPFSK